MWQKHEQTRTTLSRPPPWSIVNSSSSTEIHLCGLIITFPELLMASQSQHCSLPDWLLVWLVLPPLCSSPVIHLEVGNMRGKVTVSETIPPNTSTVGIVADVRFKANISISLNIHARATIFAALFYLVYTTIPGLLICLSTVPIRILTKPTPLDMSLAGYLHKPAITLLVSFGVADERVLRLSEVYETDSPLPFRLVVLAQRFVSWLLANDRPATYYPILMAISTSNKIVLNFLCSAARARRGVNITHKAGLFVLILGFTATAQSTSVFMRVSAFKQAALVAPGFATTLGLDILASIPSLAFRYAQVQSKVCNSLLYWESRCLNDVSSGRQ